MRIETERLILREMTEADLGPLKEILKNPAAMVAYEGPFSDQECRAWLDRQFARYARYGFGLLAVTCKGDDRLIGQCGLTMQNWREEELLEVGYLFRPDHWHRGYATEAARAARDYAFNALGAEAVHSIIRDTNRASQRVAERNGMTVADRWVKHYRGVDMPHLLYRVGRDSLD